MTTTTRRPRTVTPRPYQAEAVAALHDGLAGGGRGQLRAACGSGKTLMAVMSAGRLLPGNGLVAVFVPSLALVAQFIEDWRAFSSVDAVLAVCSDDSVTDSAVHVADVPAQVTTSPGEITAWLLGHSGRRLVVATYLSAGRLAEALHTAGHTLDLAVFDEAHHLAGRPDAATRRILDDAYLPCARRLFMTATPRIDEGRQESLGVLSMDDRDIFGPVLYSYPWARAIRDGYLDDYRITVMGVTRRDIMDMLADDDHAYTDQPGGPDLRTMAAQAILAKTAARYGLRRIIAFCPRLDAAREFAATLPAAVRRLPAGQRPPGAVHAERISGDMDHKRRAVALDRLRTPPHGEDGWSVLTNVRCLSEGVDVPSVDAVIFTAPMSSQVNIVQGVGRALRRAGSEQRTATIIVPIVIPESGEDVGDLDPGQFRVLWQVVRALRSHDETLGAELDLGRARESMGGAELPSRITVELPSGSSAELFEQLSVLTIRQVTSAWWDGYGHARAFRERHGHLAVPSSQVAEDGTRLGQWIANARQHYRKGWMSPDRVAALNEIGMVWDARDTATPWQRFRDELEAFRAGHGHVRVPQSYVSPTGYRLGSKINRVRSNPRTVPGDVRRALDDLGMIWDTRDLRWQELYDACLKYRDEHGHLDVPVNYVTLGGLRLGRRLNSARTRQHEGTLPQAEAESLAELGFSFEPAGDRFHRQWEKFIAACDRYCAENGDLSTVRKDHVDADGYRLGAAISYYRNLNNGTKTGGIPAPRREALDARGMVWRLAPARDLNNDETAQLTVLTGTDLAEAVNALISEGITQSSIATALGINKSTLNMRLKRYQQDGTWPQRGNSKTPR